jgi:pilus assembly protein CpaF
MLQARGPELDFSISLPDGRSRSLRMAIASEIWLGRDASCDVVLNNPMVSRRHLAIAERAGALFVRDNSNNGTMIGRTLLRRAECPLADAERLQVGPYVVSVRRVAALNGKGAESQTKEPRAFAGRSPAALPDAGGAANGAAKLAARELAETPLPAHALEPQVAAAPAKARDVPALTRRLIHRRLLDSLDLDRLDSAKLDLLEMRPKVQQALRRITAELAEQLPKGEQLELLIKELSDESLGLGPLEDLLADPRVSEIMVVDPETIFAEIDGKIQETLYRFTDGESVRAAIERIVTPLGRRIDESSPLVDARLKDGSRVNAIIPPLAVKGPCITIRKFARERLTIDRLVQFNSVTARMAEFLERCVRIRKNVVISGGTGSGKTTLLNILSGAIADDERVVTIEDAAELQLSQRHVVSLESRPPNMEGKGAYTIRDLVKNALRMRPDRIVVGECRGGEAIDMLQAMNTGHDGSMTTTHANSPREALSRLETLCLMSGLDLPVRAIRAQIASSVDLIVQQTRFSDGTRRVTSITEVTDLNDEGEIECFEIFAFHRTGIGKDGKVLGEFRTSGYVPSFVDQFIAHGLVPDGDFL